ncbi:MAG: type III pantothenate kinase [Chitinispirillaceae bacterium]|nr:type III pantothenate kinase [Chitinispirillaceae bacterium]
MTDPQKILAIDIGSTNTHCGVVTLPDLTVEERRDLPSGALTTGLVPLYSGYEKLPVVIAGGRQGCARETTTALRQAGFEEITPLLFHQQLPLRVAYDKPEQLGADRIADALYAINRFPGRECIVIDSGTAITIDLIGARAVFTGGAIVAGIPAQLAGLRAATGVLPAVSIPESVAADLGTSTEGCIRAGTVYGTAGALNLIVEKYRQRCDAEPVILATGGGWKITEALVNFSFTHVPDMTLAGCALYRCASSSTIT